MTIKITVCDGRAGRNEALVDADGYGEILGTAEVERPIDVGDILNLPNGDRVVVIGTTETINDQGCSMKLAVGDLP